MKTYSDLAIIAIAFAAVAFALPIEPGEKSELVDTGLPDSAFATADKHGQVQPEIAELQDVDLSTFQPFNDLSTPTQELLQDESKATKKSNHVFGTAPAVNFCRGSPQQLCRSFCANPQCAANQCAMRQGSCCDITCVTPTDAPTIAPTAERQIQYIGDRNNPNSDPYVYATRSSARAACRSAGFNGLCSKEQGQDFAKCKAGWYSDYKGYWMSEAVQGCGGRGWNGWAGNAGAYCCGRCPPSGCSRWDSVQEAALGRWAVAMLGTKDIKHCWKRSYGNGAGSPLGCPPGKVYDAGLCYTPCREGFRGTATRCHRNCPPGFRDDGLYCAKPKPYGRGAGYALWWGGPGKCQAASGGRGCERWGGLLYPRCAPGYHNVGCCICSPSCPYGKDMGVSCEKIWYDRGVGTAITHCRSGTYKSGALCYPTCQYGYHGVGPVCWSGCPAMQNYECAAGCARNRGDCNMAVVEMIKAVFQFIVAIVGQFMPGGAVALEGVKNGMKEAFDVAQNAVKAAKAVIAVAKGIESMTAISEEMQKSVEANKLKARLLEAGYNQETVDNVVMKAVAAYTEGGVFGDDGHPNTNWQMTPSLLDQMDAKVVGAIRGAAQPRINGGRASRVEFERDMESIEGPGNGNKTAISEAFDTLNEALEHAPSMLLGVVVSKVPFVGEIFGLFKAFDQETCPLDTLPRSCQDDPGVCGEGTCAGANWVCECPPGTKGPTCTATNGTAAIMELARRAHTTDLLQFRPLTSGTANGANAAIDSREDAQ